MVTLSERMDEVCKEKSMFICRYMTYQFEVIPFWSHKLRCDIPKDDGRNISQRAEREALHR